METEDLTEEEAEQAAESAFQDGWLGKNETGADFVSPRSTMAIVRKLKKEKLESRMTGVSGKENKYRGVVSKFNTVVHRDGRTPAGAPCRMWVFT